MCAFPQVLATAQRNFRVCVVGAAGGIGQPLSLLLKQSTGGNITSLSLYDVAPVTPGVGADLSHIPTAIKVDAFAGPENMKKALEGADVVVVPAGVPRKPGMTRDDLFNVNATINMNLAKACAEVCPKAAYLIISNPVNSVVPLWSRVLSKAGVYDKKKLFGVTTLDIFRANTFSAAKAGTAVSVPVVGGHAGKTIVPLFSLATPAPGFAAGEELDKVTNRVMFGGDEVVQAKAGGGSATLSMAAAGAAFTEQILSALSGKTVETIAYVDSAVAKTAYGTDFFASKITVGKNGVETIEDTAAKGNEYERKLVAEMVPDLTQQIAKGYEFFASQQ
jgi:malate dehydrogenase